MYCNRTATGLIRTGTQWTNLPRQITQNRLNKRNSRTHQYGLERVQANSQLEQVSSSSPLVGSIFCLQIS